MVNKDVKKYIRERYGKIAAGKSCGCRTEISCCSGSSGDISKAIGYSDEELASLPEGSNLGLGCGNPVALASIRKGETVVDLGSGAGIDCFLAAKKVGPSGHVIGVDMTHEMLEKARANAVKVGAKNIEFRLGEIENLPVADKIADLIISNCVINLSVDKPRVFREAFRVLRTGGRLMVSDLVLLRPLPTSVKQSVEAYVGCVAGAMMKKDYLAAMRTVGFRNIEVMDESSYPIEYIIDEKDAGEILSSARIPIDDLKRIACSVVSIKVMAKKP